MRCSIDANRIKMETKVLTENQQHTIDVVFKRFQDIDNNYNWTKIDDFMVYLEYLDDAELACEADVLFEKHKLGEPSCPSKHPKEECLVPLIMESVDCILNLYKDFGTLEPTNRYIVQYYIALTGTGDIID